MTLACVLLRHDVRPRWIGDLHAAYCTTCGCLYILAPLDSAVAASVHPPLHRNRDRAAEPV